jgi:hypothetical protein
MQRVNELTLQRAQAVEHERQLEAQLLPLTALLRRLVQSRVGKSSADMRTFGLEPHRKPRMTAETKRRANEKRQATREALGLMGKRRRARLKRGG